MSELVNIGSICENVLRYWRRYRYGVISVGFSESIGRAGSELIKAGGRTSKLECCICVTNYPDIDVRKLTYVFPGAAEHLSRIIVVQVVHSPRWKSTMVFVRMCSFPMINSTVWRNNRFMRIHKPASRIWSDFKHKYTIPVLTLQL